MQSLHLEREESDVQRTTQLAQSRLEDGVGARVRPSNPALLHSPGQPTWAWPRSWLRFYILISTLLSLNIWVLVTAFVSPLTLLLQQPWGGQRKNKTKRHPHSHSLEWNARRVPDSHSYCPANLQLLSIHVGIESTWQPNRGKVISLQILPERLLELLDSFIIAFVSSLGGELYICQIVWGKQCRVFNFAFVLLSEG